MPATNGSRLAFRSRRSLIVCCMAAVLLVSALYTSTASAAKKPPKPTHFYYLALGDSISYGYTQVKYFDNHPACVKEGISSPNCEPPAVFETGFVNYLSSRLPLPKKTSTLNLSCPKETSTGLIGHNVALGGGPRAAFNPCAWHNEVGFRRHYEYGSVSQLEAAVGFAQANPGAV